LLVRDTLVAQAATELRAYQELEGSDVPMDWTSFDEIGVCNGLHHEGATWVPNHEEQSDEHREGDGTLKPNKRSCVGQWPSADEVAELASPSRST
jgi:hypothetical protein